VNAPTAPCTEKPATAFYARHFGTLLPIRFAKDKPGSVSGVGEPEGTVAPVGDDCTQARLFKIAWYADSLALWEDADPHIPS